MLDAYIIERIRRDQDIARPRNSQIPLYIDDAPPLEKERREPEPQSEENGSEVVDFHL